MKILKLSGILFALMEYPFHFTENVCHRLKAYGCQKYQLSLDKLVENRTSFVIAHRLSKIKNVDLILVLKDGDIIESGNHEELLRKGGFYAELNNSQFEQAS